MNVILFVKYQFIELQQLYNCSLGIGSKVYWRKKFEKKQKFVKKCQHRKMKDFFEFQRKTE